MIVSAKTFKPCGPWGRSQKREYAKKMHEVEMTRALKDKHVTKKESGLFEQKIHADRVRLGLV